MNFNQGNVLWKVQMKQNKRKKLQNTLKAIKEYKFGGTKLL